ncbi:DUF262 domain-containing protein [Neolewinella agarilytica]|uniref:GmrSD restriction endonucleases N-terminal domain-containing protein n=1 Tax=Neolewinella agarilytica TaxID=478744 RepID=A0A1H9HM11_9BACT|nr:DUF262 domain-containing protein [Neolewinella agarilytica]SEQ63347.1 Protein of unknown function DUF262 [Neolewinella agarilytica]
MKTTATNTKIRKIVSDLRSEKLIPRPDFQRRLVWSNKHKNAFIKTVLENLPFPEVYIAAGEVDLATGEGKEILVDGQQRLTTLYHYFIGSKIIRLSKDVPAYEDLDNDAKKQFLEYDVVVRDLGAVPIDEIKEIFLRINSTSYSLNPMEINNARYDGEIKQFADSLAAFDFFEKHNVFSGNDLRRMNDVRFILSVVVTMMSTYFHRESEIEKYLERYNDEFDYADEIRAGFIGTLDIIEGFDFPGGYRVWNKADLFTLIVELHRTVIKESMSLDYTVLKHMLTEFYDEVDRYNKEGNEDVTSANVILYHSAVLRGTNDKSNRLARGKVIYNLIIGCMKMLN